MPITPPFLAETTGLAETPVNISINLFKSPLSKVTGCIPDDAGAKAYEQGLRTLTVQVKGPGSGRETALRSLQSKGFKILSIKDTTPMPHNGARPPKRRRV